MNSLLPMARSAKNPLSDRYSDAGEVEVPVVTVDGWCGQHGVQHVDLLKIDTQGFDLEVLMGARRMFQNLSVALVLIEVNFVSLYQQRARFGDIHSLLEKNGFSFVDFYDKRRVGGRLAWCDALYCSGSR